MKRFITYLAPLMAVFLASPAFAQNEAQKVSQYGWFALASGVAIGFAALGGGIGQGVAANGALNGIARNPSAQNKIFVPFILAMALVESLVIFAFVVALQNLGNIK